jgi:hypothetical protein
MRLPEGTTPDMRQHTTGVAFGVHGNKLVATYHAEHVYSFDIAGSSADASQKGQVYPFTQRLPRPKPATGLIESQHTSRSGDPAKVTEGEAITSM